MLRPNLANEPINPNAQRWQIYRLIREKPGITGQEIQAKQELSSIQVPNQLRELLKELVRKDSLGRYYVT